MQTTEILTPLEGHRNTCLSQVIKNKSINLAILFISFKGTSNPKRSFSEPLFEIGVEQYLSDKILVGFFSAVIAIGVPFACCSYGFGKPNFFNQPVRVDFFFVMAYSSLR